jgi:hypothetical protein
MSDIATIVWDRACYGGGEEPRQGDKHLAALLRFHGAAMNGGVFHATEFCSKRELRAAKQGFEYFGLAEVVAVVRRAESLLEAAESVGELEREFDAEYYRVCADKILFNRFKERYAELNGCPTHEPEPPRLSWRPVGVSRIDSVC